MRDLVESLATIATAVVFVDMVFKLTEHFSDNYRAWDCSEKERAWIHNKIHEVNGLIYEIECLQNNRINHPDLFGPNLASLLKQAHGVFNQARTIKAMDKMTMPRLYALNSGIKSIKEKLKALQDKDKDIESRLLDVPKEKCLVITRTSMGRLFYDLEDINAQPTEKNCIPTQYPTSSLCTTSYDTLRRKQTGYPDADPVFLPAAATPAKELTWAGQPLLR